MLKEWPRKEKGEKIKFNTMENGRFCGFVGWETMGGQMWKLHNMWVRKVTEVLKSSRSNRLMICVLFEILGMG